MLLLLAAIAIVWTIVALATIALCVTTRDRDDEIARAELHEAFEITSIA